MDATTLVGHLQSLVSGATFEAVPSVDVPTVVVTRGHIVDTCRAMRDARALRFTFLSELTAADYYPREPRFEVVYHLVRLGAQDFPESGANEPPARVRLKVTLGGDDPALDTVSGIYPNADWCERELFDLFGIVFHGHPDLRRLLLPDDWEGHPLRKDYPVQVKVPVMAGESLQLTPEEFVRNIERQRRTGVGQSRQG